MDIQIRSEGTVKVVTITGTIDGATAPVAQTQINAQGGPGAKVVLDMGGVDFMSSAGLRMLLAAYRFIGGQGGRVVLARLPEELRDTMELTGFLNFFQTFDSVAAGIAELG